MIFCTEYHNVLCGSFKHSFWAMEAFALSCALLSAFFVIFSNIVSVEKWTHHLLPYSPARNLTRDVYMYKYAKMHSPVYISDKNMENSYR